MTLNSYTGKKEKSYKASYRANAVLQVLALKGGEGPGWTGRVKEHFLEEPEDGQSQRTVRARGPSARRDSLVSGWDGI